MNSVLIFNGYPIKLVTDDYTITPLCFHSRGFVYSFKIKDTTKYEFFNLADFNKEDRTGGDIKRGMCISGYYEIDAFKRYKNRLMDIEVLNSKYFFKFTKFRKATIGDIVEVNRLNPFPFNQYYNNTRHTFKISSISPVFFKSINTFPEINTDFNSEFYSIVENVHREFESSFPGFFYMKNLGDQINNWDTNLFPDENYQDNQMVEDLNKEGLISKMSYAKLMIYICWRIKDIFIEVLPKIAINDIYEILSTYRDSLIGNDTFNFYEQLPECDKIIAEICHYWGCLKFSYIGDVIDFPATFEAENPEYAKLLSYYNSLENFYKALYFIDENVLFPQIVNGLQVTTSQDSYRRVQYLSEINTAALSLLPFTERIKLIEKYTILDEIEEEDQRFVVRIINSFNNALDADNFLDYLLKIKNGISTNFQVIYHKLDDARLERYEIIEWFVDHQTNRKYYIYLLYEMWKISKYNFQYVPVGALNVYEGTNLDGFFLDTSPNGGDKYMPKHDVNGELFSGYETSLEFRTVSNTDANSIYVHSSTQIKYESDSQMYKELIFIDEVETTKTITANIYSQAAGHYSIETSNRRFFGQYHIYQPLATFGYQENLELSVPDAQAIPAFLFYYADDFDRIRDFDAALNLSLQIVAEVALFFLFGGVGAIPHMLKYGRHISKLKYLKETANGLELVGISATEAVMVWRATEVSLEVISVSAGVMMSLFNYGAQTTNDPVKKAFYEKTCMVFMFIALGSGLGAGYARSKATKLADEILDNTLFSTLPDDVKNVLQKIRNRKVNSIINFGVNTLQPLNVTAPNLIHSFYSGLSTVLKDTFYLDFNTLIKNKEFANFLNDADILARWQQMADLKIAERVNREVLDNLSKTNAIVRYYSNAALRNVLERLTFEKRWRFLDKYGSIGGLNIERFDKLSLRTKKLDLLVESLSSIKRGQIDYLDDDDILKIIDSDLSDVSIDFLRIKNKNILAELIVNFSREINNVEIDLNILEDMFNGDAYTFINNLSPKQKKLFQSVNRLKVNIKSYINNVLVNNVDEVYVAGWRKYINDIFGNNIPSIVKEPTFVSDFNNFKQKALFKLNDSRVDDTEIKFIFNFLENHWNSGNKFVVQIKSTYYSCKSCQGYLLYLKKLASDHGKTIEITIESNIDATDFKTLYNILYQ